MNSASSALHCEILNTFKVHVNREAALLRSRDAIGGMTGMKL